MSDVVITDLDLATLATLAGNAANQHLLGAIRVRGHQALRVSHGYVFQHLIDAAPTVGELAGSLGVTQQAASKSTAELERLGYVERVADAEDNRVRRVRLTERGRHAIRVAREARTNLEAELEALVGAEALDTARTVLATLLTHVGAADAVASRRVRPTA